MGQGSDWEISPHGSAYAHPVSLCVTMSHYVSHFFNGPLVKKIEFL